MSSQALLLFKKADIYSRAEYEAFAKKQGLELVEVEASNREELLQYFDKYNVVAVAHTVPGSVAVGGFNEQVFEKLPPSVKLIAHQGAGYDTLGNVDELTRRGIQVSNTPQAVIAATADTALFLIIGALRNFGLGASVLREGSWNQYPLSKDPGDSVLGILGMGGIGRALRDKAQAALGFRKIQYHNRSRLSPEDEKDTAYVGLEELLATSDVISIHMPLNDNTHHLLDAAALAKAKPGVIIVNTARGAVIDEQALVDALESGHVGGVGLDVFEHEPKINPGLLKNKGAVLLPHAGTHSEFARRKMQLEVLANIQSFFETGHVKTLIAEQKGKF